MYYPNYSCCPSSTIVIVVSPCGSPQFQQYGHDHYSNGQYGGHGHYGPGQYGYGYGPYHPYSTCTTTTEPPTANPMSWVTLVNTTTPVPAVVPSVDESVSKKPTEIVATIAPTFTSPPNINSKKWLKK
ncbi:hypothetical protein MHBO_001053 [Bonamia ostreae]|uniref:Uncharacterized protein n=1 Tax=Bonamia ostreae TaxID=126728 RepID=A0ABV2AHN0_9EUKA